MSLIAGFINAASVVFDAYFPADVDLISPEVQAILAHPEDRKKYMDAVDNMRQGSIRETITLHTGKVLTLVR